MSNSLNRCSAEETAACCCIDVGTIIDNTDRTAVYSHVFATQSEADDMLKTLTARARATESDPCQIKSKSEQVAGGIKLDIDFTFACQAETMIFQLALR